MSKVLIILCALVFTACNKANPENNTSNDAIAGAGGEVDQPPVNEPSTKPPPPGAPAPPCEVPAELLDDEGALLCLEGTTYHQEGDREECRAGEWEVLLGHDVHPLERQILHSGASSPVSWWMSSGLLWVCGRGGEADQVILILDLARGCTVGCWVEEDDEGGYECDPC